LQQLASQRNHRFLAAVGSVEVRRWVVVVVHGDVHAMETRDARHAREDERALRRFHRPGQTIHPRIDPERVILWNAP